MSNQKHTPEPWVISRFNSGGEDLLSIEHDNTIIAAVNSWLSEPEQEANAARIVACVNYCKGTSNEELESGSLEQLKSQRDELIRVLQVVEKAIRHDRSYQNTHAVIVKMLADYTGGSHE